MDDNASSFSFCEHFYIQLSSVMLNKLIVKMNISYFVSVLNQKQSSFQWTLIAILYVQLNRDPLK